MACACPALPVKAVFECCVAYSQDSLRGGLVVRW